MALISSWISFSVFSVVEEGGAAAVLSGVAFSLSTGLLLLLLFLLDLLNNWTCVQKLRKPALICANGDVEAYIELPPLDMFSGLFAGNYNHQLRDLAAQHPLVELRHDSFNICLDLIVLRYCTKRSAYRPLVEKFQLLPSMLRPYFFTLEFC
jgi:hypothetical protein